MASIDYYNEQDISKEIDACFDTAKYNCLTAWERRFLLDVEEQVTRRIIISEKQVDVVHRIYLKLFGEKFNNDGDAGK